MDIISLLTSLNKISLIAFFIILGFLSYQFYLLKKETKSSKNKLVIPDFKETVQTKNSHFTKIIVGDEQKSYFGRPSRSPVIIGLILLIIFGLIFLMSLFNFRANNQAKKTLSVTPVVNFVASRGILIYNQNWTSVPELDLSKLKQGQIIFIGVETIPGTDMDSARIRVNNTKWKPEDITMKFNQEKQLYYREYTIATGGAFLKIEAELHSKTDGWLGK